ncbi:MAG: SUMF1/EgtB/PvdO family nonheme iron enzyme [Vicinamibacterales bacterium]
MSIDRQALVERFDRIRARTRALFALVSEEAYYARPIALRNPVVFYEGHLPAFAVNTLLRRGLGQAGIDAELERIFARGIDPEEEAAAVARGNPTWPSRNVVQQYAEEADRRVADALANADIVRDDHPLLAGGEAAWTILEHEEMHQETLAYIWHQMPYDWKRKPESYLTVPPRLTSPGPRSAEVVIPPGIAELGTDLRQAPFAWDNERPAMQRPVDAFAIDVHNVTNADFMEFVDADGYRDARWWRDEDWAWVEQASISHPFLWEQRDGQWFWRAMFERVPLPLSWPVYATWAEAHAYARWRGRRLLTEAEFHRAAYATPEGARRAYPWGNDIPARAPANFDFLRWDPEPAGRRPAGASAFGVHDLVGNGWEWTGDVFRPFDGFTPLPSYPEYSAEFFDDQHFVLKGASPVTDRHLVRAGFRNWFRPRYPYVYAAFRTVRSL